MDRSKAIDAAVSQIERQFGKGSIMRMGDEEPQKVASIPTGALALDLALGVGGVPRGMGLGGPAEAAPAEGFTFVQISDTHMGFKGEANPDPNATLRVALDMCSQFQSLFMDGACTQFVEQNGTVIEFSGVPAAGSQAVPYYAFLDQNGARNSLQIRENLKQRRLDVEQLSQIPLDIGLMNEEGYPHQGHLNYVSPEIDATTGTILVRGLFKNPDRTLLPGFFVRVRMPMGLGAAASLLVPNRVIAEDQAGKYVLTVDKDNVVHQQRIKQGLLLPGGLRVITEGLKADDRVVLTTSGRAIPGAKVVPQKGEINTAKAK